MKKIPERLAVPAIALAAGIGGTLLVQEALKENPSPVAKANVKEKLQSTNIIIGDLALDALGTKPNSVLLSEHGRMDGPTITIHSKNSLLLVGMRRVHDELDPKTTYAVEVQVKRSEPDDTGPSGYEVVRIEDSGDKGWSAHGQLATGSEPAHFIDADVSEQDPNFVNAYTMSEKAIMMAHEIADPIVTP